MRTSEERITELHRRMKAMAREKQLRRLYSIWIGSVAACITIVIFFSLGTFRMPMKTLQAAPVYASASIFANHAALRYIMVGIVAFCLGVLVTLLCMHVKRGMGNEERSDD